MTTQPQRQRQDEAGSGWATAAHLAGPLVLPVFSPLAVVPVLVLLRLAVRKDLRARAGWVNAVNTYLSALVYGAAVWTLLSPRLVLVVALAYVVTEITNAVLSTRGVERRWPGVIPFLRR